MQSTDIPGGGLAYPVDPAIYRNLLSVRGYTHERPDEYNVQYGASISRELPGAMNLTVGYTGSRGRDMFLRGVANTFDNATRVRPVPSVGQVDYKTSGCLDGLVINGNADQRLRRGELRRAADRPQPPLPLRPHRRPAVPVLAQRGHDAGLERGGDRRQHVRLQHRVRPEPRATSRTRSTVR